MGRWLGLAIVAVVAIAAPAHAGNQEDARDAMQRGIEALDAGDPQGALSEFEKAISLVPDAPVPYRYKGLALERLGRWQEAIDSYNVYLEKRPDTAEAGEIRTRLDKIRSEHLEGILALQCTPAGARVQLDGADAGVTPVELKVAPGEHAVEVSAAGYLPRRFSVAVVAGKMIMVPCELNRLPPPSLPPSGPTTTLPGKLPPRGRPWYRNPWVWAAAGAVVVAGGAATYLALPELPHTRGGDIPFPP